MQSVWTIGLDIAKSVFQAHGVDAEGQVVIRRRLTRRYVLCVLSEAVALLSWYGGLRDIASLARRTASSWPYRAADAAGLRQAPC